MLTLDINGETHRFDVPGDMPRLWVLRDVEGLIGTKFGCGNTSTGIVTLTYLGQPEARADTSYRSRNTLCARLLTPDVESGSPNSTISIGVQKVSTRMEVAMDECVNEKEVLSLFG